MFGLKFGKRPLTPEEQLQKIEELEEANVRADELRKKAVSDNYNLIMFRDGKYGIKRKRDGKFHDFDNGHGWWASDKNYAFFDTSCKRDISEKDALGIYDIFIESMLTNIDEGRVIK